MMRGGAATTSALLVFIGLGLIAAVEAGAPSGLRAYSPPGVHSGPARVPPPVAGIPGPCTQPAGNCRLPDRFNALMSNRTEFLSADDFSPAIGGAVTSVCWWGAYLGTGGTNCQGVAPDTFRIRYFADSNGVPGGILGTFSQADATLTLEGPAPTSELIAGEFAEYAYRASHAAVAVSAGGRYWIEISNSPTPACQWFWETAALTDARVVQDGTETSPPDGYTSDDIFRNDLAFCLNLPLPPSPTNDFCAGAQSVGDRTEVDFNNTNATLDGPAHAACAPPPPDPDVRQIEHDLWYCWTSPCTETVFVRTCGRTQVDTRIAVYQGCACPVSDANLVVCEDDGCGYQSTLQSIFQTFAQFPATQGQSYLIRVGTHPGAPGGRGAFQITCGPPDNPACVATGSCCEGQDTPGCCDERCCETVCACDPFCCDTEWDADCADDGYLQTGCGAKTLCGYCDGMCGDPCLGDCCVGHAPGAGGCGNEACCERVCACDPFCCTNEWDVHCATDGFNKGCDAVTLCPELCSVQCPAGPVAFLDPPSGILDARRPHLPQDANALQGTRSFRVSAPAGAERAQCWTLCESGGAAVNSIDSIVPNGDGTLTVHLVNPLTAGRVTRLTYTNDQNQTFTGAWTSHPANANADGFADPADVSALRTALGGGAGVPDSPYNRDLDHSGRFTPADLLEAADLLVAAGEFLPWNGTPKPTATGPCP